MKAARRRIEMTIEKTYIFSEAKENEVKGHLLGCASCKDTTSREIDALLKAT